MDIFSKTSSFPKKHHRCISLESSQAFTKKSFQKTLSDVPPRYLPRRYSTPELAMRKHTLKCRRDDGTGDGQPISNKSCQTDILGLDKYLQRSSPLGDASSPNSAALQRTYKRPPKKPKVRSVAVHCERRRLTLAAFKGCQKFKHVYKRKISLPQPSSSSIPTTTCSSTSADDGRRDSGVLPKLRPDRTMETERPAAAKAGPVVKLPRIPRTRDLKPEPDRTDDGAGSSTRLARLTRPQSTGSSNGGTGTSDDRKLAYFRARSAPKINSQFNTRFDPSQPLLQPPLPQEREQSTTPGSSDTADTTLDMSFVRQKPLDNSTVTGTNSTTKTVATATVSTSTSFTEPIFPIVFSCESVLRHPLDGGYVSHTESHRFSVHYVPVEDTKVTVATDTDGSRSSLVFTSAGACQSERCLNDDSISVTPGSKPNDSTVLQFAPLSTSTSTSTSTSNTIGERRLVIEHLNTDVQFKNIPNSVGVPGETIIEAVTSPADCHLPVDENQHLHHPVETSRDDDEMNATQMQNVLEKDNAVINHNANVFDKAIVPPMPANKIIDSFGDDGEEEGTTMLLESHARTDVMLLQPADQNYERLTQNHQIVDDSGRTVSNQSPKPDGTVKQLGVVELLNNLKPVGDDNAHAIDILSNTQPTANVESTKRSTDFKLAKQSVITEPTKRSINDEPLQKQYDSNYFDQSRENLEDMACKQHYCNELLMEKHGTGRNRTNVYENTDDRPIHLNNMLHYESTDKRHFSNRRNVPPIRLQDEVSRKRDENRERLVDRNPDHISSHLQGTNTHLNTQHRHDEPNGQNEIFDDYNIMHSQCRTNNVVPKRSVNNQYCGQLGVQANNSMNGKRGGRSDIDSREYDRVRPKMTEQREQYRPDTRQRANPHVDTNVCHRCTNSMSNEKNETKNGVENLHYNIDHNMNHDRNSYGDGKYPLSKYRLDSVDESTEASKVSNNYIGGFLFGDGFYNRKRPEKYEADNERDGRLKYGYYDDAKKVNFSSRPNGHYEYYQDYVPKTRYSPRDEDCTVFANMPLQNSGDCNKTHGVRCNQYTSTAAEPVHQTYYSKLDNKLPYGVDDKNTDSDESLTDSLEDGKYEGSAVSYFLALDGQKSAVTFTLKMPNTLESRLNRRQSQLKKHLHVSTTVTKKHTSTRVRTRHKSCQTLWTEEKGVQVQRGSTANATRKPVDDHKVFETLLAGLERNRVSENQIRVVGGQKMVSEGNQTEQPAGGPPSNRQTQTRAITQEVGVGPRTPENSTGVAGGRKIKSQQHTVQKFSSDNALMVGVVRQNKYKGKESLQDGAAKNDQLLTLSKGWINFYTLGPESADADVQELHDNDDEVKLEDDNQQYTVHVQAIPEPVTLPVVHVPNRNALHLPKSCSAAKHLPRLVQPENNNHHCPPHLVTTNGWCVSVDGPNNMHMKVSLLPDKSDIKTSEHFDLNEENKLEARRLALQRKNNCMRRPYRNIKRTQSTPRDMFSADVSRTESAMSAESKYIETIDTQLLIHKARRRLSQEWDTRIQNGGVTESVQLVVTGDSVSRAAQNYANRGHQHCSFRRQSRRI